MNTKNLIQNLTHSVGIVAFIMLLLSANRINMPGTPYELVMWEIKANEGYRSKWYPDGWNAGRRAYSIGFGWNDLGQRRRHEIKHFLKDGKISYAEATQITVMELNKYGRLHKDPYKNAALLLYSYNCGRTTNGNRLGRCCGATWGCGNSDPNIRKSHSRRRQFELALWHKNVQLLRKYTNTNKDKIRIILSTLNKKGDLK